MLRAEGMRDDPTGRCRRPVGTLRTPTVDPLRARPPRSARRSPYADPSSVAIVRGARDRLSSGLLLSVVRVTRRGLYSSGSGETGGYACRRSANRRASGHPRTRSRSRRTAGSRARPPGYPAQEHDREDQGEDARPPGPRWRPREANLSTESRSGRRVHPWLVVRCRPVVTGLRTSRVSPGSLTASAWSRRAGSIQCVRNAKAGSNPL